MLSIGKHLFYAAADPGVKGAIALLSADKAMAKVWPMPINAEGEYDLDGLQKIFRHLKALPDVVIGIEWPTAWPGAFANVIRDAEFFGRGKAYLEAFAFLHGLEHRRITPQLWKQRLGLPGKSHAGADARAVARFQELLPQHEGLIRGPRGGLHDGPMDALLIAEALRSGILAAKYSALMELGKKWKNQTEP